jgi:thymidylate synthase
MYQRSADMPLGMPFNIASYALFTHMIAQVCNLEVGDLIISVGDAHIYNNQIVGVKEQLLRTPLPLPTLKLNPDISVITEFDMNDIELVNYQSHDPIRFIMSV